MTHPHRSLCAYLLILTAFLPLGGCNDRQQTAVKKLHDMDLKFTVKDFQASAAQGDLKAVGQFLEAGMEADVPTETGMTALIRAAENDRAEVVELLLEKGATPDLAGPNDRTALIGAAQAGATEVLRYLLKSGADPYQQDVDDWSALTLAAYKGHVEGVEVLAPRTTDYLDDALLVSAFEGNPEIMDILLNNGAYVNARSPNNQTALMIAAMNGHEDAAKLLLHNGANRYALDDKELTAANLAEGNGHAVIAEMLNQPPAMQEEMFLPREVVEAPAPGDDAALVEHAEVVAAAAGAGDAVAAFEVTSLDGQDAVSGGAALEAVVQGQGGAPEGSAGGFEVAPADGGARDMGAPATGGQDAGSPSETYVVNEPPKTEAVAASSGPVPVRSGSVSAANTNRRTALKRVDGIVLELADQATVNEEPAPLVEQGVAKRAAIPDALATVGGPGEDAAVPSEIEKEMDAVEELAGASPSTSKPAEEGDGKWREEEDDGVAERFRMTDYREQHLPIMLKDVDGGRAEVRILYGDSAPIEVTEGEAIADTGLRVVKMERKFVSSKQGQGSYVDVSEMIVEERETGMKHLLVKDVPAKGSQTFAVMKLDSSGESYDVRLHDEFATGTGDAEERFQVIDVRPTQVVIKQVVSGELYTIPRVASAMR